MRSLSLVRVNLLARHSTRASNVSTVGPNSIISRPGWPAFFDSDLCTVGCGDEFGRWNLTERERVTLSAVLGMIAKVSST